jgi:hypothetical protein
MLKRDFFFKIMERCCLNPRQDLKGPENLGRACMCVHTATPGMQAGTPRFVVVSSRSAISGWRCVCVNVHLNNARVQPWWWWASSRGRRSAYCLPQLACVRR